MRSQKAKEAGALTQLRLRSTSSAQPPLAVGLCVKCDRRSTIYTHASRHGPKSSISSGAVEKLVPWRIGCTQNGKL